MSRILVLDDSSFFIKAVTIELENGGYQVSSAKEHKQAINIYLQEDIELIILDIQMPDKDGFEVCELIQQEEKFKKSPVPFIFFTGTDKQENRIKGFELGATDFLLKDFSDGQLVRTVNSILRPELKFNALKAVVVDDMPVVVKLISGHLMQLGIECVNFTESLKAYEYLKLNYNTVDLLITDREMPGMDGTQLVHKVRKELALHEIPIIVISADVSKESAIEIFQLGATDYLVKPFIKEEFMARVSSLADSYLLKKGMAANLLRLKQLSSLKDQFLSICSHDLRSPLTGILGFAELLQEEKLNDEQQSYVKQIVKSGNFLLELINNLLDLRAFELDDRLDLRPCKLSDLIEQSICGMNGMAVTKNIQINFKDSNPVTITGDAIALVRCFNNLLSNSLKFSPDNSKLEILLKVESVNTVKFATIYFIDQGIGIAQDKIPGLFREYSKHHQLGTAGEVGTGLGLSIVKKIIDQHKGKISVQSKIGAGTSFIVQLPI